MNFGSLMGNAGMIGNGGILGGLQRMMPGQVAPQVPADGAMQPTIGPGVAPAPVAAQQAPVKMGLPQGGLLGLLQGQSPQGLMGLLQRYMPGGAPGAAPMAQAPAVSQAGMLPGMPGSPFQGPASPKLPTDINPMNQF